MKEYLSFLDSLIHDEVYCAKNELASARRQNELAHEYGVMKDRGIHAAHRLLMKLAPYIREHLEYPYEQLGYRVLGAGFRSTAYTDDNFNTVKKMHRASVYMNDVDKEALLTCYQKLQYTTEYYLGQYALHQTFSLEQRPLRPNKTAVTGQQPIVTFSALPMRPDTLSTHLQHQLHDFVGRSEQMLLDTGYVVDVKGTNNLVITTDERLLLIDTIPCDPFVAPERALSLACRRLYELDPLHEKQKTSLS